jgi:hypothetical protein
MPEPPLIAYPRAAAQLAVSRGVPLEAAYRIASSLGANVSRAAFGQHYAEAEIAASSVGPTSSLPLDQLPPADLIQTMTTVTSRGYLYQTSVGAIDKETGEIIEIPYSVKTPDLINPSEAIDAAYVSQTLRAPEYNLQVIDARLTGVYALNPEVETE